MKQVSLLLLLCLLGVSCAKSGGGKPSIGVNPAKEAPQEEPLIVPPVEEVVEEPEPIVIPTYTEEVQNIEVWENGKSVYSEDLRKIQKVIIKVKNLRLAEAIFGNYTQARDVCYVHASNAPDNKVYYFGCRTQTVLNAASTRWSGVNTLRVDTSTDYNKPILGTFKKLMRWQELALSGNIEPEDLGLELRLDGSPIDVLDSQIKFVGSTSNIEEMIVEFDVEKDISGELSIFLHGNPDKKTTTTGFVSYPVTQRTDRVFIENYGDKRVMPIYYVNGRSLPYSYDNTLVGIGYIHGSTETTQTKSTDKLRMSLDIEFQAYREDDVIPGEESEGGNQ